VTSITYPSPRLRKEFERAETLADAANARVEQLRALQAALDAAISDPDAVICDPSMGLPYVAQVARITKRDIVFTNGRRARERTGRGRYERWCGPLRVISWSHKNWHWSVAGLGHGQSSTQEEAQDQAWATACREVHGSMRDLGAWTLRLRVAGAVHADREV